MSFTLGLLVSVVGVVGIGCAMWQAGTIVTRLLELVGPRSAAGSALPKAASATMPISPPVTSEVPRELVAPVSLVAIDANGSTRSEPDGASFEASAEAHEAAIPVGLDLEGVADPLLEPGEVPPPSHPRPRCDDIFVYIVTIAEGAPQRSAASLGLGKAGPARFRQVGETFGDFAVLSITDDSTGLNPAVWLGKNGSVCKAELAGNPTRVHAPLKPPPQTSAAKPRKRRR
jgi:hypothetical protein